MLAFFTDNRIVWNIRGRVFHKLDTRLGRIVSFIGGGHGDPIPGLQGQTIRHINREITLFIRLGLYGVFTPWESHFNFRIRFGFPMDLNVCIAHRFKVGAIRRRGILSRYL